MLEMSLYVVVRNQRVEPTGYRYAFLSEGRREIVVYHWHPGTPPVVWPHLHLGSGTGLACSELYKLHIPTGPVTWQDVLLLVGEWAHRA